MALILDLTPEQERHMKTEAARRGMETTAYAVTLLTQLMPTEAGTRAGECGGGTARPRFDERCGDAGLLGA